jgi:flagellar basal body-associated protein FliL
MDTYDKIIITCLLIVALLGIVNAAYWLGKKINKYDDEN